MRSFVWIVSLSMLIIPGISTAASESSRRESGAELSSLRDAVDAEPSNPFSRAELAKRLLGQARQSGSVHLLDEAEAETREGLRLSPDYAPLQLLDIELEIYRGHWEAALPKAQALNQRMPDALETYSQLVRIYLALDRIDDAAEAAQWMFTLREQDPLSLQRAADVREHAGDLIGALELLNEAIQLQSPTQPFEQAFLFAKLARLHYQRAETQEDTEAAQALAGQIRERYPDSPELKTILERIP